MVSNNSFWWSLFVPKHELQDMDMAFVESKQKGLVKIQVVTIACYQSKESALVADCACDYPPKTGRSVP